MAGSELELLVHIPSYITAAGKCCPHKNFKRYTRDTSSCSQANILNTDRISFFTLFLTGSSMTPLA